MRRRNYARIEAWLTPANVERFYRAIDEHRRKRSGPTRTANTALEALRAAKSDAQASPAHAWNHWTATTAARCGQEVPHAEAIRHSH